MDAALRNSSHGPHKVKDHDHKNKPESTPSDHTCHDEDNIFLKRSSLMVKRETSPPELNSMASLSTHREKDDQLITSAKVEMREVKEENQRLRMQLDRIMKDYRNLQKQFHDIHVQKETDQKSSSTVNTSHHESEEEAELVSLSLGRTCSDMKKEELSKILTKHEEDHKEGLTLGLDCKFEVCKNTRPAESSPVNLSSENSLEENGETCPPSKALKTMRNGDDDDVSQQNPTKRARVSVRARCDTPTMNDGCQWRKYGQKIAKGNPCPRAYYRCTVAPSCPVRKQVQRCADDMSILITTYEGTHNHALPVSATAMASTTSAAASMLLSGSSTSSQHVSSSSNILNGLNFYLSDASKSKPYYYPNSSAPNNSLPTITLDLTSNSSISHLNRMGSTSFPPRYNSTTNLNFSSLESNPLPISWSNGVLTYGNHQTYNNKNAFSSSTSPRETPIFQSYLQRTNTQTALPQDTIAAATKVITSDPKFQSALAAALSSIMSNTETHVTQPFPILSSLPTSSSNPSNSCFSSSSPNAASGNNLVFLTRSNSLPFSNKGKSTTSPSRDENKLD